MFGIKKILISQCLVKDLIYIKLLVNYQDLKQVILQANIYKYMGPYNPLHEQLEYDKNTVEVNKWYVQSYNKVDEIAAYHDICYEMGKNKGDCDHQVVKALDEIPYGEMPN